MRVDGRLDGLLTRAAESWAVGSAYLVEVQVE